MPEIPHPIPYQGSKRRLAGLILAFGPDGVETLFEPFCGSAAVSVAAAHTSRARRFALSNSLGPLAALWAEILRDPHGVADRYERLWHGQRGDRRAWYDAIRAGFNQDQGPAKLLFLLARCVKGAVRFNRAGEFNPSPDKRRAATHPGRMRRSLAGAAGLLAGSSDVSAGDYAVALSSATSRDLVYLDPPYQGRAGGASSAGSPRATPRAATKPPGPGRRVGEASPGSPGPCSPRGARPPHPSLST